MAIPLKFGGEIIGILDLQSELSSAFGEQDIELLTIVADQVAIAIQNARRFQETQKANRDAETLYGETVHKQWVAYTLDRDNIGYRYSGTSIHPLEQRVENSNIRLAIQNKASRFTQETTGSKLAVPIQLRGQVIGVLNIEYQGKRTWNQDEIDITKSIAERVSLAIENARLLQDAQSRAAKERVIGDIASKLSSSNNMDIIFQTAAKELGLVIPDAEVIVQFLSEVNDED
jgi:GAF domain-containing protein